MSEATGSSIASASSDRDVILDVQDLRLATDLGTVELVHGVSFHVNDGESLGIVGESGSGKTLISKAILGILPEGVERTGGSIAFEGKEITDLGYDEWLPLRGPGLGAVFQDPGSYLNPSITVGKQLYEVLRVKRRLSRRESKQGAIDMLEQIGMRDPRKVYGQYPFELSGGMLQRVLIALAIAQDPRLLIADEATTALDVTVQADVLDLLGDLRETYGLSLIVISHDLAVIAQLCERVIVLRHGEVLEEGSTQEVLHHPQHDYTRLLVDNHTLYDLADAGSSTGRS